MLVNAVKRVKPNKVLGIDTSTNSLAFCLFEGGKPKLHGKVLITGADIYDKVLDANKKASALMSLWEVDYVVIEKAIMGKNADGSLKIAMIVGAALSGILTDKTKVITVAPVSWQSFIGNKLLTKAEKQVIKDETPGKSENWYKLRERELRKSRTIKWAEDEHGIVLTDNDVADAVGIAYWGVNNI